MFFEGSLLGLGIVCFLSATILPLSSEAVVLLFLGNSFDPILIICIASIGNILGGLSNIWLGRKGRSWLRKDKPIRFEKQIATYGYGLAFFSWVPFIGDPLLLALGVYRTPLLPTIFMMAIGKILRYIVLSWSYLTLF